MSTCTLKVTRPDREETEYFWKLFRAANRNDSRWCGSLLTSLADELSLTNLDRVQKLFLMRAWQVLVDDRGGFGRFMSSFETYVLNMQDPDDECVAWKPELSKLLCDGEVLDVVAEAYHDARQRIDELENILGETYQVVGVMADALGIFENESVQNVLDNLSRHKMIHADILPFSLPAFNSMYISKAAADVLAERSRQVTAEGWTYEHDDEHATGELALAAAAYLENYARAPWVKLEDGKTVEWKDAPMPAVWPWGSCFWKPTNARRDLVKACALALAELEKGDRQYEASKEDA